METLKWQEATDVRHHATAAFQTAINHNDDSQWGNKMDWNPPIITHGSVNIAFWTYDPDLFVSWTSDIDQDNGQQWLEFACYWQHWYIFNHRAWQATHHMPQYQTIKSLQAANYDLITPFLLSSYHWTSCAPCSQHIHTCVTENVLAWYEILAMEWCYPCK